MEFLWGHPVYHWTHTRTHTQSINQSINQSTNQTNNQSNTHIASCLYTSDVTVFPDASSGPAPTRWCDVISALSTGKGHPFSMLTSGVSAPQQLDSSLDKFIPIIPTTETGDYF